MSTREPGQPSEPAPPCTFDGVPRTEKLYLIYAFIAVGLVVLAFAAFSGGLDGEDWVQAIIIGLAAVLGVFIGRRIARNRS